MYTQPNCMRKHTTWMSSHVDSMRAHPHPRTLTRNCRTKTLKIEIY